METTETTSPPPSILIAFATNHGQTARIATRIADTLLREAIDTTVLGIDGNRSAKPEDYDAVVVAGSLHLGRYQREIVRWVKDNAPTLRSRPNVFISVSLSAAEDTAESRDAIAHCINRFADNAGWHPTRSISVAGALPYSRYGFFTKLLMRWMMKRGGHPTDTSRDYEYTDWEKVDEIARELVTYARPHERHDLVPDGAGVQA